MDADFGPFFLKFCSYFPYNAKLCINGHEYAKRQLAKEGIAFEALDNGIRSCADARRLQQICDGLGPDQMRLAAQVAGALLAYDLDRDAQDSSRYLVYEGAGRAWPTWRPTCRRRPSRPCWRNSRRSPPDRRNCRSSSRRVNKRRRGRACLPSW